MLENYTIFKELTKNEYKFMYCLIALVPQPLKTKGSDFMCTFTAYDINSDQFRIRYFFKNLKNFEVKKGDIVKISALKLFSEGLALMSHNSKLEIISESDSEKNLIILSRSEKEIQEIFKEIYRKKIEIQTFTKISDIKEKSIFNFRGKLIDIQEDDDQRKILKFVDETKMDLENKSCENMNLNSNEILSVKVWDNKKSENCQIGKLYEIKNIKAGNFSENSQIFANLSEYQDKEIVEITEPLEKTKSDRKTIKNIVNNVNDMEIGFNHINMELYIVPERFCEKKICAKCFKENGDSVCCKDHTKSIKYLNVILKKEDEKILAKSITQDLSKRILEVQKENTYLFLIYVYENQGIKDYVIVDIYL